jgi:hypothetical protein
MVRSEEQELASRISVSVNSNIVRCTCTLQYMHYTVHGALTLLYTKDKRLPGDLSDECTCCFCSVQDLRCMHYVPAGGV